MFIVIALLILLTIALLAFRDRIRRTLFSRHEIHHLLTKAKGKIALGEWEEAKEMLLPLIEKNISDKEVLLCAIATLLETGEHEKGYVYAKKGSFEFPEELLFRVVEGKALLFLGRPQEAYASFQVAFPILKSESDLMAYAEAALLAGAPHVALEILDPYVATSKNGKLFSLLGDSFSCLQQFEKAVLAYQKAQSFGYDNRQLEISFAHALRRLGNILEAEHLFRRILKKDGGDVLATIGLGNCMQAKGEHMRALSLFRSSKAWDKKDPLLSIQAGILALFLRRDAMAEECFAAALSREVSPELLFYFGYSLQRQKKWQDAEKVFIAMIERYPNDLRGMEALAWLFSAGLSATLSVERGVFIAKSLYAKRTDTASAEILSAAEARAGNFERALEIQETLALQDRNSEEIARRRQCVRSLRRHLPLDDSLLRRRVA